MERTEIKPLVIPAKMFSIVQAIENVEENICFTDILLLENGLVQLTSQNCSNQDEQVVKEILEELFDTYVIITYVSNNNICYCFSYRDAMTHMFPENK